jgi:hypothetical protein
MNRKKGKAVRRNPQKTALIVLLLLHHIEHEVHQFFEGHFTISAEILLSFFGTVFIFCFLQEVSNHFKTIFFYVILPYPGLSRLLGNVYLLTC